MPATLRIEGLDNIKAKSIQLLGAPKSKLKFKQEAAAIEINVPSKLQSAPPANHIWVFKIS